MKKLLIILLVSTCGMELSAQHASSFILSYPVGFPMSSMSDYVTKPAWRGVSMEFTKQGVKDWDFGIELSYNVFYERMDSKVYTRGTASISGIQYRYVNAVPMLAEAKWIKTRTLGFSPYVGAGIGTLYVNQSTDFGLYRITNDAWQFLVRPEAGGIYKISPDFGLLAGVKYNWAFKGGDLDAQSYLTANVGLIFTY